MSDASKRVAARAYARVYLNVERGLWAWIESTRLFRALTPSRSWLKGVRRNLMSAAA